MLQDQLKQFIFNWNNLFLLDKWWRDKYKVSFNSKQHLEANQADILIEYIESSMYEEHTVKTLDLLKKEDRFKKDGWISKNEEVEEVSEDDFNNIEI